jgi:hypothetical protein
MIAAKRKAMRRLLKSRHCSPIATDTATGTTVEVAIAVAEETTPTPAIVTVAADGGADGMPVF